MLVQTFCHVALALLGWFVIPDTAFEDAKVEAAFSTLKVAVPLKILYTSAFCYHMGCYFFEGSTQNRLRNAACIAIAGLMCWHEYFVLPIAFCLSAVAWPSIQFILHGRKESLMTLHHMVTILLVLFSWYFHVTTIGSLVMFANDVTDIPMFLLRMQREKEGKGRESAYQIFMAGVVFVSWIYYRLVFMTRLTLAVFIAGCSNVQYDLWFFERLGCIVGLCVLLAMNTYWISLLTRKILDAVYKFMCPK